MEHNNILAPPNYEINALKYGTKFITARRSNDQSEAYGSLNAVHYDDLGVMWIPRTSPGDSYQGVCWSPDLNIFVAVAGGGSNGRVATSSDGIDWAAHTAASESIWRAVVWSPSLNRFVAVATNYEGIMSSE